MSAGTPASMTAWSSRSLSATLTRCVIDSVRPLDQPGEMNHSVGPAQQRNQIAGRGVGRFEPRARKLAAWCTSRCRDDLVHAGLVLQRLEHARIRRSGGAEHDTLHTAPIRQPPLDTTRAALHKRDRGWARQRTRGSTSFR